jgi:hypothetical protein
MVCLVNIVGVSADHLESVWPLVAPKLERALIRTVGHKLYTLDSIKSSIADRDMQLWVVVDKTELLAAAVTQILIYPKATVLDVPFVGGTGYADWGAKLNAELIAFATAQDCKYIRGYGRLGWVKPLARYNAKPSLYFDIEVEGIPHEATIH